MAFASWVGSLPFAARWGLVWHEDGSPTSIYEPWQILMYMGAAALAGILVSLVSRPTGTARLDLFYALTRTPIQPGEVIDQPCTLPLGVEPATRRMLLTCWGFEIPQPSRTSLVGFLGGWLCVAALIGGFLWIVR